MSIRAVAICASLLSPFILAAGAVAQTYPTRPIRLVIPYPPGGVVDAIGRPWADRMKSLLGTVVVENIGGGGGEIGAASVSRRFPMATLYFSRTAASW